MDLEQKKREIFGLLTLQNSLFNVRKCPNRDLDFQYIFHEEEGICQFYLSIRHKKSIVVEGVVSQPVCEINSDIQTMKEIVGGYISPIRALREKRLIVKGNISLSKKIYSGDTEWKLPNHLFTGTYQIKTIKKVLILNCSPRCEKGVTSMMVEHLAAGMKKAGAEVEIICPAQLKINPCMGCFQCFENNLSQCVNHEKDDFRIILEKYLTCDLVVWATPIYFYFGTSTMKTVIERLFINIDPHTIMVDGEFRHPRKIEHLPYYAVLALGGFPTVNIFESLQQNFRTWSNHTGIKVIGEIYRHTCMAFSEDFKMKKKDEVIRALEKAGLELIELQKITRKTKKDVEQKLFNPKLVLTRNSLIDLNQKERIRR